MLDTLAFGSRVVGPVTLHEVDHTPYANAAAQGNNQSRHRRNSSRKETHNKILLEFKKRVDMLSVWFLDWSGPFQALPGQADGYAFSSAPPFWKIPGRSGFSPGSGYKNLPLNHRRKRRLTPWLSFPIHEPLRRKIPF